MKSDDVGMSEPAHDGDLSLDVGHQIGANDFVLVDDFNCDALPIPDISGVVDFCKCAAAQKFSDFVFAEQGINRYDGRCCRDRGFFVR